MKTVSKISNNQSFVDKSSWINGKQHKIEPSPLFSLHHPRPLPYIPRPPLKLKCSTKFLTHLSNKSEIKLFLQILPIIPLSCLENHKVKFPCINITQSFLFLLLTPPRQVRDIHQHGQELGYQLQWRIFRACIDTICWWTFWMFVTFFLDF